MCPAHLQADARRLCAGALAGAGALLLTHPLDTMRTRLAASRVFADELAYRGLIDCCTATWRQEGIRGFYAGCAVSLLEIAPYTAISFAGYEGLKQRLRHTKHGRKFAQPFAGLVSGAVATTVCYPLDTLRRQLMLEGARGYEARYERSFIKCCTILWLEGGLKRFYRGWSVTLLKSVPTIAITFVVNDSLKELCAG